MPQNRYGKLSQIELNLRNVQADRLHKEGIIRHNFGSLRVQRPQPTINSLGTLEITQQKDYL